MSAPEHGITAGSAGSQPFQAEGFLASSASASPASPPGTAAMGRSVVMGYGLASAGAGGGAGGGAAVAATAAAAAGAVFDAEYDAFSEPAARGSAGAGGALVVATYMQSAPGAALQTYQDFTDLQAGLKQAIHSGSAFNGEVPYARLLEAASAKAGAGAGAYANVALAAAGSPPPPPPFPPAPVSRLLQAACAGGCCGGGRSNLGSLFWHYVTFSASIAGSAIGARKSSRLMVATGLTLAVATVGHAVLTKPVKAILVRDVLWAAQKCVNAYAWIKSWF